MRALACFLLLIALLPSTFASAQPLRIVTEPWAPYVYLNGSEPAGVDYEIAAHVFKRLGVQVEWEFLPWKRCLMMLQQDQADGILDIFHTTAREQTLVYADEGLSKVEFALYQANERPVPVARLRDLRGLRVGVAPGFLYGPAFSASQALKEPAPTLEANFGKLMLGRVDLVITDRRVGRFTLQQMKLTEQVSELPGTLNTDVLYLALRRRGDLPALAEQFTTALREFKREPEYRALLKRYGL
ncbi:transporter substrate-binding domain-containing protein [Pseudomonas sp. RIT-PI-S]|uniref:substrate-binding periplasmic protein n=1 Tax=Pseudomonas sp. RIT-PI-S TaxID=3035295 RepID=UPI0021DAA6EF|nr:transporter substrate-binding domain-containing protein [Pseudomonas sp. RIT-PI-S]